jgi:MOSC domain-containing protein YiiM
LERDAQGTLIRKAGVMAMVVAGGDVRPGDPITAEVPPEPHRSLEVVCAWS